MKRTSIVDELKAGRSVTYFTVGTSMQPLLLERRTHVTIRPLAKAEAGDILLYVRENGKLVLHRLIQQDADHYYLRGDNTYELETLSKAQAIGVVSHIYRKGKTLDVKKNAAYRMYVAFWNTIYPLRLMARRVKQLIWRIVK